MKHRHSFFIHRPDDHGGFELDSETNAVLKVRHLQAAREWKATVDAQDLDVNLRNELGTARLTVQFVSAKRASSIPEPLQRGFVQGLHFLWPENPEGVSEMPLVIRRILGKSTSKAIQLPKALSYLHINNPPSATLDALFAMLWNLLGPTDPLLLAPLAKADVIEIDILPSSSVQMRAVWASSPNPEGWSLDIPSVEGTRTEVGIFREDKGEDKDEYAIGGVHVILGEDQDFRPTMFTFPHRHHIASSNPVVSTLSPSYGSHPNIRTILSRSELVPPINDTLDYETCTLHGLYTLSKEVFVDKYQLAQLAQFQSGGIRNLRGVWGETDLENPSYKTEGWGSVVLIDIAIPELSEDLALELPVHLRYLEPIDGGGYTPVTLLSPQIFWTCENSIEDFSVSPFGPSSRSLLATLFPGETVFYHLPNHSVSGPDGQLSLQVPVGDASQGTLVQSLTGLGVLLGFTYLFVKGVRLGLKGLRWRGKGKEKAKDI